MSLRVTTFAVLLALFIAVGCTTKPGDGERAGGEAAGEAAEGAQVEDAAAAAAEYEAAAEEAREAAKRVQITRLLPMGTLAYVSLDDVTRAKEEFEETALRKLYDEPEVQAFLERPRARLEEAFDEAEQKSGLEFDDFIAALGGQVVVALTNLGLGDQGPRFAVVAVATVTDAEAAGRLLDVAVREAKADPPSTAKLSDIGREGWRGLKLEATRAEEPDAVLALSETMAVAAVYSKGDTTVEGILSGEGPGAGQSLADLEDFKRVTEKIGEKRVYTAYVAADALRVAIMDLARDEDPKDTELAERIVAKLGLDRVLALGAGISVDAPGLTSRLYVKAPAPRTGVFEVLPADDLDERTKAAATAEALNFVAVRFDPAALMKLIEDIAEIAGEKEQMDQSLMMAGTMLGLDIEKDLIGSLGTQFVTMMFPGQRSANPMVGPYLGLVVAMEVSDAAKIKSIMTTLLGMADMMLKAQGMELKTEDVGGVAVKSVDIMGTIAPCVAVSDTHVILAGSMLAARKGLGLLAGKNAKPLVGTPAFDALAAKVGGLDGPHLIYQDHGKGVVSGLQTLQGMLAMSSGRDRRELDEWFDMEKMPSAEVLSRHLFGQLDVVHASDDGLLFVGHGPFGGWAGPALAGATAAGVAAPLALTARGRPGPESIREPVDEGVEELF